MRLVHARLSGVFHWDGDGDGLHSATGKGPGRPILEYYTHDSVCTAHADCTNNGSEKKKSTRSFASWGVT